MKEFQYIMVTDWDGHWDQLRKWRYSTLYTASYINFDYPDDAATSEGFWPKEACTLFIKLSSTNKRFEKSWIGISKGFRETKYKDKPAIRFEVDELQATECPDEFKAYSSGWYTGDSKINIPIIPTMAKGMAEIEPPFFHEMAITTSWEAFEQYCFKLLRLIGIHEIQYYPSDNNRGKADGLFIFSNLVVIYDATLENYFQERKADQISNYVNQLKESKVTISNRIHTITGFHKQVWIITRRPEKEIFPIEDGIEVKEIPFTRLIELYHQRFKMSLGADKLRDILKDLE